jgi:hypothetical protein
MARQVHATRAVGMRLEEFPVPVTLLHDEYAFDASILVHRPIGIDHDDHPSCPCEPHKFTRKEIEALTCDDLNQLLTTDIH